MEKVSFSGDSTSKIKVNLPEMQYIVAEPINNESTKTLQQ